MVAGHENTSSGMAWTLHQLSLNPDVQRKLREELLAVETDTPSYEQLSALPYLEKVRIVFVQSAQSSPAHPRSSARRCGCTRR